MKLVDPELLLSNCAGDKSMVHELAGMGLERIQESVREMPAACAAQEWDNLARSVHKLRPVLNYCGIVSLSEDLLWIETHAKEKQELSALPAKVQNSVSLLERARVELEQALQEEFKI